MTLLTRAALEENFVPAQSALGDIYAQMGLWNDAASFYSLSVANGYRANMGKLIELSQLIGAPRHLIDSLMEEKERYSVDTFNATMETAMTPLRIERTCACVAVSHISAGRICHAGTQIYPGYV